MPLQSWWLLAGVVGMYVYDATLLLYHNEVVFFERRDGTWSFSVGSEFELAGRHVYVPALLAPHRAVLRLRWSSAQTLSASRPLRGLRAWRVGVSASAWPVMLLVMVFAALPVVLFNSVLVLLGWMIVLYAVIVFAVLRVWRLRKVTGIGGKEFTGIASDALLCAPYSLDLVRKQGLRAAESFDVVSTAHRLLDASERLRLSASIRAKVQRQMDIEETGSERHAQLTTYLQQIEGALA
ncbi:hypothetical protein C8J98_103284 [Luteibacter sp. OK325]|uniref:hypothetical protein n=1 Tax=Luteibacter sp. OK325 TaxID=2135670 RepID=UPI000D36B2DF|nr:hypothetical protein [Luteibacter sp. OK325]PTR33521.1 hypothetical protein C8J98_103284 [Luteibacter sp. OK325]